MKKMKVIAAAGATILTGGLLFGAGNGVSSEPVNNSYVADSRDIFTTLCFGTLFTFIDVAGNPLFADDLNGDNGLPFPGIPLPAGVPFGTTPTDGPVDGLDRVPVAASAQMGGTAFAIATDGGVTEADTRAAGGLAPALRGSIQLTGDTDGDGFNDGDTNKNGLQDGNENFVPQVYVANGGTCATWVAMDTLEYPGQSGAFAAGLTSGNVRNDWDNVYPGPPHNLTAVVKLVDIDGVGPGLPVPTMEIDFLIYFPGANFAASRPIPTTRSHDPLVSGLVHPECVDPNSSSAFILSNQAGGTPRPLNPCGSVAQ